MRWLLLVPAVVAEVAATLALKVPLRERVWSVAVVLGYVLSFALLAACLRVGMPVGATYGLWGAGGVTLTALFAWLLLDEPLTGRWASC